MKKQFTLTIYEDCVVLEINGNVFGEEFYSNPKQRREKINELSAFGFTLATEYESVSIKIINKLK